MTATRSTCLTCGASVAAAWLSRHYAVTGHTYRGEADAAPDPITTIDRHSLPERTRAMTLRSRIAAGPLAAPHAHGISGHGTSYLLPECDACNSPAAIAERRERRAIVQSPFTRRALAGTLPAKDLGR